MLVAKCEVPSVSALDRDLVEKAYFQDSYRATLNHREAGIVEIFFAIFGHHPLWVKFLLVVRNRIAVACGLDAPTTAEMMNTEIRNNYSVGDKIGVWPIFMLNRTELIAGRDNRHLDFRLSVLRTEDDGVASVTVSTLCKVHNAAGKIYLFFIVPFHKWGVQRMFSRAISEGRL